MGKLKRGLKLTALCILNPHRLVGVAILTWTSEAIYFIADKLDDLARFLDNFADDVNSKSPLIGKRISKSLDADYLKLRRQKQNRLIINNDEE